MNKKGNKGHMHCWLAVYSCTVKPMKSKKDNSISTTQFTEMSLVVYIHMFTSLLKNQGENTFSIKFLRCAFNMP